MNKVILIGGSHHNGLGLVRSFGVNGIRPYGIIVCPLGGDSYLTHSRYWEKTYCVASDEAAVDLLYKKFSGEKEKPIVIPWSDSTEYSIDSQLDKLKEYFILPSISGKQGAIVDLMDKQKQVDFAAAHNLQMAKLWIVNLDEGMPYDIVYPCMMKPVTSAEGAKLDIRKCDDEDSAINYLATLKQKGYYRILIQEYVNFDEELEFVGSVGKSDAYILSRNIREWPEVGGTNSYFQVIVDDAACKVAKQILKTFHEINYCGMFDVELFRVKDHILVNEFNWRNTGNVFFCHGINVHYAVIWVKEMLGADCKTMKHFCIDTSKYAMNEATDLRHVVFSKLTLFKWLKDLWRTNSFALWFWRDPLPALYQYKHLVLEFIKRCN